RLAPGRAAAPPDPCWTQTQHGGQTRRSGCRRGRPALLRDVRGWVASPTTGRTRQGPRGEPSASNPSTRAIRPGLIVSFGEYPRAPGRLEDQAGGGMSREIQPEPAKSDAQEDRGTRPPGSGLGNRLGWWAPSPPEPPASRPARVSRRRGSQPETVEVGPWPTRHPRPCCKG